MRKSSLAQGLLIACLLMLVTASLKSRDSSSLFNRILSFPDKVFGRIDKEANKYEQKITQQTDKYLNKLQRQEEKLKRKLWRTDSAKAKEPLTGASVPFPTHPLLNVKLSGSLDAFQICRFVTGVRKRKISMFTVT